MFLSCAGRGLCLTVQCSALSICLGSRNCCWLCCLLCLWQCLYCFSLWLKWREFGTHGTWWPVRCCWPRSLRFLLYRSSTCSGLVVMLLYAGGTWFCTVTCFWQVRHFGILQSWWGILATPRVSLGTWLTLCTLWQHLLLPLWIVPTYPGG